MSKITKHTLWKLPVNNGDGSASVRLFTTKAKAEHYESLESEPFGDGPCPITFLIQDGKIIGPDLDPKHYDEV